MTAPAVTVVVATFNYGQYIAQALDSVLAQTFDDWELLVIDDGSTDGTAAIVARYLTDSRCRYQRTDHVGQPAAKNLGIRLARGRFVAFLDADDVWMPTKLAAQLALFGDQPRLGVVYSRRQVIDPEGRPRPYAEAAPHRGAVLRAMYRNNFVCFSSSVVRREVFEAVGMFDERLPLAIDYDLWLRVAQHYLFDLVDEPLALYRAGHASLARRGEERLHIVLGIMRRLVQREEVRKELGTATIRQAFCETYCSLGLAQRDRSVAAAWRSYLRAAANHPFRRAPWRGVAALLLPEGARRLLRRALGRPVSWQSVAAPSSSRDCPISAEPSTTMLEAT